MQDLSTFGVSQLSSYSAEAKVEKETIIKEMSNVTGMISSGGLSPPR